MRKRPDVREWVFKAEQDCQTAEALLDYIALSERYRPERINKQIKTLLVAEGPPPNSKSYFYLPSKMNPHRDMENYCSLSATIFHHYFGEVPSDEKQYEDFLGRLQSEGIFLIDVLDEPLKVRGCPENMQKVKRDISTLRRRMIKRDIGVPDERIIFLLPRGGYINCVKQEFPGCKYSFWKKFRMDVR